MKGKQRKHRITKKRNPLTCHFLGSIPPLFYHHAPQVAPFLIAVSPIGANAQPQGFVYAPQDIAVGSVGALYSPRGSVVAPTKYAYGRTRVDLTPKSEGGGRKRRLLLEDEKEEGEKAGESGGDSSEVNNNKNGNNNKDSDDNAAAADDLEKKFVLSDDPLDLSRDFPLDYRNWAAVLSQVLLAKEGSSAERARESLKRVMLTAHGHLAKVASGEEIVPRFHLQDPVLSSSGGASPPLLPPPPPFPPNLSSPFGITPPKTSATGFSSSATFLNYAPCVLSESHTGFSGSVAGLSFNPTLFSFSGVHLEADATIINIQPQLIYLVNKVNQVEPQGFNVQVRSFFFNFIFSSMRIRSFSFFQLHFLFFILKKKSNIKNQTSLARLDLYWPHRCQRPAPGSEVRRREEEREKEEEEEKENGKDQSLRFLVKRGISHLFSITESIPKTQRKQHPTHRNQRFPGGSEQPARRSFGVADANLDRQRRREVRPAAARLQSDGVQPQRRRRRRRRGGDGGTLRA